MILLILSLTMRKECSFARIFVFGEVLITGFGTHINGEFYLVFI